MKRVQLIGAVLASCCAASVYAQNGPVGPVEVTKAIQQDTLPSLSHANVHADGYNRWHFHPEDRKSVV